MLVLRLTGTVAVLGVFGILAWIGYTLATTPPPPPIEELEKELEKELKEIEEEREEKIIILVKGAGKVIEEGLELYSEGKSGLKYVWSPQDILLNFFLMGWEDRISRTS